MSHANQTVGLVGLGNMGSALAKRLAQRCPLVAFDVNPSPAVVEAAERGVFTLARSLADMAAADTVILSLPAPEISRRVVAELLGSLAPGSRIVETSTVNPMDVLDLQEACAPAALRVIDAAILSGVQQSLEGVATLLVGGDASDVAALRDVLSSFAATVEHLGPLGSGMAAKVINNAVAHATMVTLAEAGALAAAWSIPRARLAALLASPDGGLIRPLTHRFRERVLRGDYVGGMPTEAAHKDSVLALRLAEHGKVPTFTIQAADAVYQLALEAGLARRDYAAIATLWEDWTGRSLRDPEVTND